METAQEFGPYRLGIKFGPFDARARKCAVELTLASGPPDAPADGVTVTLSQAGLEKLSLVFQDAALRLPAQGPGDYELSLTRPGGEIIGLVSLKIEEGQSPKHQEG